MRIDYNAIVPIPEEANHPRKAGGRVFLVTRKNYIVDKQYNSDQRISLGKSISDTEMHPNDNYKILYPDEFNKHVPYAKQLPDVTKIIGPYACFLAIGQHIELYPVLVNSFGPQNANMIMDYAMYSILTHSNVAKDFESTMQKHMVFSKKVYSDSWLSDFFRSKLTDEQGRLFIENWILHCKNVGISSAWICIDGSNDDCEATNMFEAEPGHDKSGNNGPIVSYMWAVSSIDGTPITYRPYRGSRVDSVALKELVVYLKEFGIKTEGVILDRGFWNIEDVKCLREAGLDFIIMMKGGHGFDQMLETHGQELRGENVRLMLNRSGSYGIVENVRAFKNSDEQLYVALMYSNIRAAKATNKLTDKVKASIAEACERIRQGQPYTIDNAIKQYVTITRHRGRKKDTVEINEAALQQTIDKQGFAALAMSKDLTAQQADDIYSLRQQSEKQYAAFKTQLGYHVLRVYTTDSWHSKFSCGFIAGIIRNEFVNRCIHAGVDANLALKELDFISMTRVKDTLYVYVRLMSSIAKRVLSEHGLIEQDMSLIADAENERINGELLHPVHQLPQREAVKRGPGRPKGSKNKAKKNTSSEPKRKPGRPKGSKNKSSTDNQ